MQKYLVPTIWALAGCLLSAVIIGLVGLFGIQISGALAGAQYDVDNAVVAVATPRIPFVRYTAVAVICFLAIALSVGARKVLARPSSIAVQWGMVAGGAAMIVWAMLLRGAVLESGQGSGPLPGVSGWVLYGGGSSASHLLLVVLLAIAVMGLRDAQLRTTNGSAGAGAV